MSEATSQKVDQIALRIGLDRDATSAYEAMAERLKAENAHVKLSPSRYIAFIVKRYFEMYFESDLKLITRQFFDSKEYLTAELRKAKTPDEVRATLEKFMQETDSVEERSKRGRVKKANAQV